MRRKHAIILLLVAAAAGGATWYGWLRPHKPPVETIASIQAKLSKAPTDAGLHEQLAGLLLTAGETAHATAEYETALQYDGNRTSARCGLAGILASQRKMVEAQKLLEINLKQSPRDAATNELLGDIILKTLGEKTPEVAYPLAAAYFDTALQGDPTRAVAALGLSQIFLEQGRLSDAAGALQKAVVAHPRSAALHLQKARIYALARRYDQATDEYNQGTALDPKNTQALLEWGVMLIDSGRPEAAETVLRRALDLEPRNPQFHMHLARALWDEGLSKADAMKEFEKALDCDPKYVPVYVEIANTLLTKHDIANDTSAEKFLRDALVIDAAYTPAKIALAKLLLTSSNPAQRQPWEAADWLRKAVEDTREQDVSLLVAYADALAGVKVYDMAVEQVEKAIAWGGTHALRPEHMEILYTRRQYYLIAQMPPVDGDAKLAVFSVEGRVIQDPMDKLWPFPQQPVVKSLVPLPGDLTQPPQPGSLLDPKNFTGKALPAPSVFTRVMP